MILTELFETSHLPRLNRRAIKREVADNLRDGRKAVKKQIRRARSKMVATIRRQYFLSHAYRDMQAATRRNEDIFIVALIMLVVLTCAVAASFANIVFFFLQNTVAFADATGFSAVLALGTAGGVLSVLGSWFLALMLNFLSLATMDGATRRVNRSARTTARRALRLTSRVTTSWLVLLAVLLVPIAVMAVGGLLYATFGSLPLGKLLVGAQAGIIAGLAWIILALMNYGLLPYVVLFEPGLTMRESLARSRQLVRRRGRLFILAGYGLLSLVFGGLYMLAGYLDSKLGLNKWLFIFMASLPVVTISNGMLVAFYRKRRLARK